MICELQFRGCVLGQDSAYIRSTHKLNAWGSIMIGLHPIWGGGE